MYKSKILVVEDDPAITNLIRTTLETQDYQYHTAKSGSAALMDAVSYNADVIILDLGLPDMDGVEIIRKCSQRQKRRPGQGGGAGCRCR